MTVSEAVHAFSITAANEQQTGSLTGCCCFTAASLNCARTANQPRRLLTADTVCLPAAPRVCAVIDCERQEADNNNTEFANTH